MKFAILFLGVFCCANLATASRILFLFPSPSKSHLIVVKGLSTTLAERGHDVTVVSPFPLDKPIKNYRDIKVEIPNDMLELSKAQLEKPQGNIFKMLPRLLKNLFTMGDDMLSSAEFKKVMDEEKFDLVVIGMFFNNYLLGVGDHFKCPTIMLSVGGAFTMTNLIFGNPLAVTSVRHPFFQTDVKTFGDRVMNFLIHGGDFAMNAYNNYVQKQHYEKNFPSSRYISYEAANKNLSLILLNSHFSQGGTRPYVPAMIEVGGLQVKPKADKLPEKIQSWLDGAPAEGVVFFSLGSNAKTTFLPREKIEILLNVFSKLKQRVIMKWESDDLKGKPANVLTSKWLPQDDVLTHPKLRLFISHCGLGSVAEAKYHGVPVVAMPLGIDQVSNADSIVAEGWAVKVDYETLTEKDLTKALQEVLQNPLYKATAKKLSDLYRDRPMNARETASYWVEYVIRHRGAPHLRYPGADLNFWEYNSVDVVVFLLFTAYIVMKILFTLGRFLIRRVCGSTKSAIQKKQEKNKKTN